jgi:hypothetical protein
MPDVLLTVPDQEEALSRVYAQAVAARAGYLTANYDFDRDGVDLRIQAGGAERPALELQLKATINLGQSHDGYFRFPLNRRNYDLLRGETQTPRILMVLDLPNDEAQWMTITTAELILRHRAYWLNLRGFQETTNQSSVTVPIPTENLFNVDSLRRLMEQSRGGKLQ